MEPTVKSVDGVEAPKVVVAEQPKQTLNESGDIVINLDEPLKPEEDAIQEPKAEEIPLQPEADSGEEAGEAPEEKEEEVRATSLGEVHDPEEIKADETSKPALERVEKSDESPAPAPKQEEILPEVKTQIELPENVNKLVSFMNETGGSVEDFINLNKDIDKLDDVDVIKEFYKSKSPHLDGEDISFMMDEKFLFDEDEDTEREVRAKKIAFKEELYDARKYLTTQKDKYYAELKSGPNMNLSAETQEAVSFYNEQKAASDSQAQLNQVFLERTDKFFSDDFKGFDFKVGDEKFRINVSDTAKVKQEQSDLNNFISKFVGEDGTMTNPAGFHKAMYAANNVDDLAKHFYEQGRADAIKQGAKESKNIDMGGRSDMTSSPSNQQGIKVRVVPESNISDFRVKTK